PNFAGAESAARHLTGIQQWRNARIVKANPDSPQLPVRAAAIEAGKSVYMAVPRLREERPFVLLDPGRLEGNARRLVSIRRASELGRHVTLQDVAPVDLIVCGTVAVNRKGVRVGKGGGYSDIEFALLVEAGVVGDRTAIVTTVHPSQVVDQDLPETAHDFRVDVVVTADEVIRCRRVKRPRGILWEHLDPRKIQAVPALAALQPR
ncbi:MAG: 5-formyltetrahydrofolate cyclo-ligase, partial [Actinomycetota bacterium]